MINADELLEKATRQTGLADLGDNAVMEPYRFLINCLNEEAGLNQTGAMIVSGTLVSYLANRLRVIDWVKQHPQIRERPVDRPMFVFGLPRTGTTLTINLLNEDPERRSMLRWEAFDSVPPPRPDELHAGPRYQAAQDQIEQSLKRAPHVAAIHFEDADSPAECQFSMAPSFCAQVYDSQFAMPTYHKWFLYEADYRPAFQYMKLLLQHLSSETGGCWTLKNPWHPLFLDTLHETFPDAQLVMTHRDPAEVVGSACSLIWNVRKFYTDTVDREQLGRDVLETFDVMIARQDAFRAKHGSASIYDIQYKKQVADPIGTMRSLYARFEEEFSPEKESRMRQYVDNKPKDRFGKHVYYLEDYGLTASQVRDHFSSYIERFDIPTS